MYRIKQIKINDHKASRWQRSSAKNALEARQQAEQKFGNNKHLQIGKIFWRDGSAKTTVIAEKMDDKPWYWVRY